MTEFVRFVQRHPDASDTWAVFGALDEEKLQRLHAIDTDLWESLIPPYCAWAMGSFDFNFCDVLVRRLEEVFNLGSLDAKAASALAIAELGASHNRWHVMGRLFLLCGPALDERVARRIAIEIGVEGKEDQFRSCAARITKTIEEYHPLIAQALRESADRGR